jgi:cation diffusion facilitator CzcD-associated flavoprotein CzcO
MDLTPTVDTEVAIIGTGPAGLAVGACLRRRGVPFEIFERSERVAPAWHQHYRRLHLHTPKRSSALPYKPFPANYPRYPSRQQFVDYLEDYAATFELRPRFGEEVTTVRPTERDHWEIVTNKTHCTARAVVVASGLSVNRNAPTWPGLEAFRGPIVHSANYVDGAPYRGQRVLVVGFGNSGAEIAIDLWEHGAKPSVSVRGPVTIIPRDLFGIPIVTVATAFSFLSAAVIDFFFRPILRGVIGDLSKYGLRPPDDGPMVQVAKSSHVPVLDIGTVQLIKEGKLKVAPGIKSVTEAGVVFDDGSSDAFDAIILATGLRPKLDFLKVDQSSEWQRQPGSIPIKGRAALPNLYFCGFHVTATGMLREIAVEARNIAARIRGNRA